MLLLAVMVAIVSTVGWLIASLLRVLNDPFADGVLATVSGAGPLGVILLFVALMTVVVVLLGGARRLGRMTRPMDELIEAAGRIESGDYSARVTEYGPRELRSVARAFNAMSTRLKASDERRRSFLADVTHELRTPLSVIRGQAEALADGVYVADAEHVAPILDATQTLEALVEDLRTLALTEAGSLVLSREPVEPASLVYDTIASFEPQAEAANVTLSAEIDQGVGMVDVDVQRLRRVIGNVVSNALRHTHAGGSVRVGVGSEPDRVVITVTDTGEGIAPELLPRVFERFVRGPGSTGSGLGLAIVHDIVTAHGGDVDIESKVGEGTTLRLKLPSAPRGSVPVG
jgi:two-component system sensor histidine kinase BaeS